VATVIRFSLPGGPRAAREARERLAAHSRMFPGLIRRDALLLLTELVTNAVRHGDANHGRPVEVRVDQSGRGLRIAVTDPGRGFHRLERHGPDPLKGGGYGLVLVERLATRWGDEREAEATTVWFELRVA
jgi:anti-sigma regulatory factor (Ser/Thr protein kinase)